MSVAACDNCKRYYVLEREGEGSNLCPRCLQPLRPSDKTESVAYLRRDQTGPDLPVPSEDNATSWVGTDLQIADNIVRWALTVLEEVRGRRAEMASRRGEMRRQQSELKQLLDETREALMRSRSLGGIEPFGARSRPRAKPRVYTEKPP